MPHRSAEQRIFADGERVQVVAYASEVGDGRAATAGGNNANADADADADALVTPTYDAYQSEVLAPLFLAAMVTARTAALPTLPCAPLRWRAPSYAPESEWSPLLPMRRCSLWRCRLHARTWTWTSCAACSLLPRRYAPTEDTSVPPPGTYTFSGCRTGACSFLVVATGATSDAELAADKAAAAAAGYVSPFGAAGATKIGEAPLRCTPMEGAFKRPPMDEGDTRSGVGVWRGDPAQPLLHHPVWLQYRRRLLYPDRRDDAMPSTPRVNLPAARRAGGRAPRVPYSQFVAALRSAEAEARASSVPGSAAIYLPGRMRVVDIPADVQRRCGIFCEPERPIPPAYILDGGGGGGDDTSDTTTTTTTTTTSEGGGAPTTQLHQPQPQPRYGYCAPTKTGDAGDCAHGSSGSWRIGDGASRVRDVAGCVARCRGCGRCRYVSVSLREGDCSWYHACDMDALLTEFALEHHSYAVVVGAPRSTSPARAPEVATTAAAATAAATAATAVTAAAAATATTTAARLPSTRRARRGDAVERSRRGRSERGAKRDDGSRKSRRRAGAAVPDAADEQSVDGSSRSSRSSRVGGGGTLAEHVRWWSAVVALYAVLCLASSRSSRRRGAASAEFAPVASLARAAERMWRLRLLPGLVVELIY